MSEKNDVKSHLLTVPLVLFRISSDNKISQEFEAYIAILRILVPFANENDIYRLPMNISIALYRDFNNNEYKNTDPKITSNHDFNAYENIFVVTIYVVNAKEEDAKKIISQLELSASAESSNFCKHNIENRIYLHSTEIMNLTG